jgi:hypothetical protein
VHGDGLSGQRPNTGGQKAVCGMNDRGTPRSGNPTAREADREADLEAAREAGRRDYGRDETVEERADRLWNELLQEVRVAQTGVQILLGFLLSIGFTPRFETVSPFDKAVYVVTVVLGALATGALIAPVSFHRMLGGRRMKPAMVTAAGRLITLGVVLLAATVGASLLLLLHVTIGSFTAAWIVAGVMAWFVVCWLVLPVRVRHRGQRPPLR